MAILKAPLRLSRALYPMGSMLLASHPGGMESAWLRAANPAAATAKAPPAAAHRRYFMERIRFPHGCGQWPIVRAHSDEMESVQVAAGLFLYRPCNHNHIFKQPAPLTT